MESSHFFSRFFCADLYLPIGDLGVGDHPWGVLKRLPLIVPRKRKLLGTLLKDFGRFSEVCAQCKKTIEARGKGWKFHIFFQIFCVDLYLPIGDLGGRGPSLGVLKRLPLIVPRKRQLLRTYTKGFWAVPWGLGSM